MAHSSMAASTAGASPRRPLAGAGTSRWGEKVIKTFLALCAAFSILVTTGIVISLVVPTVNFFGQIPLVEFLTGTTWAPAFANPSFGVLPIVVGTLIVVVTALAVAIPVGLASAIYLSEYASSRVRKVVKPALEVLEGIPTVAIGLFAFFFMRPLAERYLPFLPWDTPFSIGIAGVAVGLLIVPLVASVSEDAMRSVPAGLREGAYALGASKMRVSMRVIFPAAISGIIAAVVLGTSRAIGETMVVLIAAGAGNPNLTFNWFGSAQTMTAYIGGTATGDISQGTVVYDTIFAVGALLFTMTLTMNIIATRLVRRFREVYE
ncbi:MULTISPECIES: phosphate ABC transporter permease subunit PstC [Nocardiopsis]|uniref:Phosphate transport system permease protein n=1 Tax=Nocardiopsis sinuspersici TaxID=501010 RepID=A0A1V3C5P2_9ACTN|nr:MULTISPECIES: phosphate ABC transporter permease subunit PstC [Nocardiopsis]NYH52490.1 phosphate transport system permease protein [Nocardiopsis sinuspersici]OOC55968.1 phosphate ABC transporter permease subunit PstC [Nocardiopsis sinuspersici]